jgi:hypothetical protein
MIIAYPKAKRKTQFVNITRILRNTNLSKEVTAMKKLSYLYCILCFGFLLGIHDGRIALWKGDDPEPVKVFPYFASMLPEADQRALQNGIHLDEDADLRKLLEDYLS